MLLCPWNSPVKNTRVGSHALLQGIVLAQGWNLCLLQWQADSLPLSHLGSLCFSKGGQREAIHLSPSHLVVIPCGDSGLLGCFAHRQAGTKQFIAFLLVPNEL